MKYAQNEYSFKQIFRRTRPNPTGKQKVTQSTLSYFEYLMDFSSGWSISILNIDPSTP